MEAGTQKNRLLFIALFLFCANILIFYLYFSFYKSIDVLTFAMLDVGQGDAILIKTPSGKDILVDAGPKDVITTALPKVMSPFDRAIDILIITNPDEDHIGGFDNVLDIYDVGLVIEPGTYNPSTTYKNLKEKIVEKKVQNILARAGTHIDFGDGVVMEILFPDRDVSSWESNDGSVIAKLTYGEQTFLLTGDATTKTEKIILEKYPKEFLDVDILKVGHHGSHTSTSDIFVRAITPKYALISDGKNNKYGHPHKAVLDTLADYGAQILRTDELGTIILTCGKIRECKIKK